jgi:cell division protein FtsQ
MTTRYSAHLRPRHEAPASVEVPLDVRLMHVASSFLIVVCGLGLLVGGGWSLLRLPLFALSGITVMGDVHHNNAVTLRANIAGRLSGNFFTADLSRVRDAFEAVPWVRQAMVQREFPNRLRITLQEQQPVAFWGDDGDARLLNSFGEVFEVNLDDLDDNKLPRLNGPDSQSQQVLAMYQALKPQFDRMSLNVQRLELSERGSWRAQVTHGTAAMQAGEHGAAIELGRGSVSDVMQRVHRLSDTLAQITQKLGRHVSAMEAADLRYDNGYAIRLRGVSTTNDASGKP